MQPKATVCYDSCTERNKLIAATQTFKKNSLEKRDKRTGVW